MIHTVIFSPTLSDFGYVVQFRLAILTEKTLNHKLCAGLCVEGQNKTEETKGTLITLFSNVQQNVPSVCNRIRLGRWSYKQKGGDIKS